MKAPAAFRAMVALTALEASSLSSPDENKNADQPQQGKSRRRWKIAGFTLLGIVLLFLLVVFVLPSPAARLAIESQLDDLGVQHDGVDSVEIDLWNSEVKAGPITFHAGDADDGQIGEAGFRYSLKHLFDKRALVELFFIRGIELVVKRDEDGTMTLNGIDLAELAGGEDPEKEKEEPDDAEKSDFGVGVDSFEFTDSKLTFVDISGGSLTLDVKRLMVSDFRTWDPDTPGKVELESSVNGIGWNWQGTATPFDDDIAISLQTQLRDGTIDKVAQFTGPTGLVRQAAQFESDMDFDFTLKPDGQIDGTIKGEIRLSEVDIATEDGAGISFPAAQIALDLLQGVKPDGTRKVAGDIGVGSSSVAVAGPAGEKIDLTDFNFQVEDLDFTRYADPAEGDADAEDVAGQEGTSGTGQPRTVVELLLQQAEAFALRAIRDRMEIAASPTISASAGSFALPGEARGPEQAIRFTNFSAAAPGVDSKSLSDGGWSVTAAFDATLESAWAGPAGQEDSAGIFASGGNLSAGKITTETNKDGTSISFDVTSGLDEVAIKDPAGMNLTLSGIAAGTPGMTVEGQGGGQGHIRGPVEIGVDSLQSAVPAEDGDLSLAAKTFRFGSEDFDIIGEDGLSLELSAALGLTALQLEKAGEAPVALGLDEISIDLGAMTIDPLGPGATVTGKIDTALSNLQLALGATDQAQEISIAATTIGLDSVALATAEPVTLDLSGEVELQDTQAKLPVADGGVQEVAVATTKIGLDELALSTAEALSLDMKGNVAFTDTTAKLPAAGGGAQEISVASTEIGLDQVALSTAEPLSLNMAGAIAVSDTTAKLPMANGDIMEAKVAQVGLNGLTAAAEGEAFNTATDIDIQTIAVTTDAEVPQVIDVAGIAVDGLKVDATQGIEIASVLVNQLNAEITDAIAALGGAPAEKPQAEGGAEGGAEGEAEEPASEIADNEVTSDGGTEEAEPEATAPAEAPAGDSPPFKLGKAEISSGSNIKVTDTSVEPPMKLEIAIDKMEVGPVDTAAPETQTAIDLATTINQDSTIKASGWASPLLPTPDFDLTADVAKLPLPPFSPYVSSAAGLNIDSGILNTQAKATSGGGALKGQIDVQVGELFLEPVSEEVDKEFEGNYGISANFATGLLKNDEGIIDLGFPVGGTVEEPAIDYSEVISKALGGAMASLFPLNWFGDDGSSFEILPATFEPASTDLTADGKAAGDEIGRILTDKSQLSIRVCGKATASDLIVLRGGTLPAAVAPEGEGEASEEAAAENGAGEAGAEAAAESEADGASQESTNQDSANQDSAEEGATEEQAAPAPPSLAKPSQEEVDKLLDLALKRGEVMRAYLTEAHGISADRMSECRTSYSIEDGKAPRAEFRF